MIATQIGDVDLEDARIIQVRRLGPDIWIRLDSVRIHAEGRRAETIKGPELKLSGVNSELAQFYPGGPESAVVITSDPPVDFIAVANYRDGVLTLQGYKNNVPWYTWRVEAAHIQIVRGGKNTDAT